MSDIIGVVALLLGLAFFVVVTVAKAKIGWSFVNHREKED